MADQTRKPKPKKDEEQKEAEATKAPEETTKDMDELLDEIDEVLESNAEEFVRSYIQKGGQARALPLPRLPKLRGWDPAFA